MYLISSAGGEEHKVTFDSYNDGNPQFSHDGRKLYFVRSEGGFGGGGGGQASSQIYVMTLEREDRDPNDPEDRPEPVDSAGSSK